MTSLRHTTFRFTLLPTATQEQTLWRHAGAARFAFNQALRLVKDALEAKRRGEDVFVPWTGFDQINSINKWKRSAAAGLGEDGKPGLAWRGEVLQQVFEEAAVDLGRALANFSARRTNGSRGAGFPKFKKRSDARQAFRIRNKTSGGRSAVEVGDAGSPRSIRLPKLGLLAVREDTRKLRRMIARGRAKILFATISHETGGRWTVSLNLEAAALHPANRHEVVANPIGIDRGLQTFAVLADGMGREVERIEAPRPLRRALPKLRRLSRDLSRKKKGSRNRHRARLRLSKFHQRIGNVRRAFVHRVSSRLAKTHSHLVVETLSTAGLMQTRMARSLADSSWAKFADALTYKLQWRGGALQRANRFYPSTRRCSACSEVGEAIPLSERTFRCRFCGHEADRDTNAAACLAQYPGVQWPPVAAKQAETKNVCREESAGAWARPTRGTVLVEAERASARRPRRAVLAA
ncbi:RNA-guided endonuclease InsQ/TnpB family protein [Vulgatibacter sp.]|uniref:RNA-guided endonuclease InsQ/TnpB family protein n=1 Tax=Vulgatibacter sp. TaxID=1971226 RepID=UPI003564FEF4